jgi:CRISPR-associated exonuclease Cas4
MEFLFFLAVVLLALAVAALWFSRRARRAGGLPPGRVISSDMGGWKRQEKPLYDPQSGLTGRPDYLVEQNGAIIPVEVKSGWAPSDPHPGHLYQLAAYCLLVERTWGSRPPYGILHYRNRTFAIDYTTALEEELLALVEELRLQQRRTEAARSHDSPARCARCGYRDTCDQRLK